MVNVLKVEVAPSDLLKSRLYKGLSDSEIKQLSQVHNVVEVDLGERFIEENATTDSIYFILDGKVDVDISLVGTDRREVIASVGPGDTVGEFALAFDNRRRTASAKAITKVKAIRAHNEELIKFFDKHPEIGYQVFRNLAGILAGRLQDANMLTRTAFSTLSQLV